LIARPFVGEVDGVGVEAKRSQVQVHVLPAPGIAFQEMDAGKFDLFQVELQAFGRILYFFEGGIGVREIVDEELIVPYRVRTLKFDGGVFETDILQLGFVLEEPPIRDIDLYGAGEQKRIRFAVLNQGAVEEHLIEEGEVDVFYLDAGMEVVGEAGGDPGYQPGLDGGQVDKTPE